MRRNTTEEFWARVDKSGGDDACWPWTGRCQPSGHGVYDHDNTYSYAHRYAYTLTYGEPENFVLHRCDNAPCCNVVNHLYDGTQQQNIRDRDERGRRDVRGERHPRAKLSDDDCNEIRGLYSSGGYTQKAIATQYGVDHSTISLIVRGRRKRSDRSRSDAGNALDGRSARDPRRVGT